ncbi:MAG: hypothetical protein HYW27_02535 [Candidatus Aenigmarchaeota archaeon]|nr:hypothetical protein [Candidatus Aenigmarchaeota archaeon]
MVEMIQKMKEFAADNRLASGVIALVVLMDLAFVIRQYLAAAALMAIAVVAVMAMMVNELRKE